MKTSLENNKASGSFNVTCTLVMMRTYLITIGKEKKACKLD